MRADQVLIEHLKKLAMELEPRHRHLVESAAARIRQLTRPAAKPKLTVKPPVMTATPAASVPALKDRHVGH